jgi:hypothetical protein
MYKIFQIGFLLQYICFLCLLLVLQKYISCCHTLLTPSAYVKFQLMFQVV